MKSFDLLAGAQTIDSLQYRVIQLKREALGGQGVRDRDIRIALKSRLSAKHHDDPDTLLVDELDICAGSSRIDIAVVNGYLNGYEIKSEQDTLDRLPSQQSAYSRVFDNVTIVVDPKHTKTAAKLIPPWWGITEVAGEKDGAISLQQVRPGTRNETVDGYALAQLLWRDEALGILEDRGLAHGVLSKPRRVLWERLAEALSAQELSFEVRRALRKRERWRSGSAP